MRALIFRSTLTLRSTPGFTAQNSNTATPSPNGFPGAAWNKLNAGFEVPFAVNSISLSLFGRVNNILDEEARNHVSVIKDLAPLPGRSYSAGIQATF